MNPRHNKGKSLWGFYGDKCENCFMIQNVLEGKDRDKLEKKHFMKINF